MYIIYITKERARFPLSRLGTGDGAIAKSGVLSVQHSVGLKCISIILMYLLALPIINLITLMSTLHHINNHPVISKDGT